MSCLVLGAFSRAVVGEVWCGLGLDLGRVFVAAGVGARARSLRKVAVLAARRELRHARRRWKRLMRTLRGEHAAAPPRLKVASWNAEKLYARWAEAGRARGDDDGGGRWRRLLLRASRVRLLRLVRGADKNAGDCPRERRSSRGTMMMMMIR